MVGEKTFALPSSKVIIDISSVCERVAGLMSIYIKT